MVHLSSMVFISLKELISEDEFRGQIFTSKHCSMNCGYQSLTFESFTTLNLLIPKGSSFLLAQILDYMAYQSSLDGYTCPKCEMIETVVQYERLSILPRTLILHFVKFELKENNFQKSNTKIKLDFNPITLPPQILGKEYGLDNTYYHVVGIMSHIGGVNGGHYYCYVKRDRRWYCMDDSVVTYVPDIDLELDIESTPYVVFLRRIE